MGGRKAVGPMPDVSGGPVGDLPARELLEAALAEVPVLVSVTDAAGTYELVCGGGLRALGVDRDLVGSSVSDVIPDDHPVAQFDRKARAGEPQTYSGLALGRRFWTGAVWPVFEGGDVVRVVGVAVDTTEAELAKRALARSKSRFESIVRNSVDLFCTFDADLHMTWVSPSARRLSGFAREEVVGGHLLGFIHPDDHAATAALLDRLRDTPGGVGELEVRGIVADGSWHDWEMVVTNLLDDPSIGGWLINSRDVTDRRRAEEQVAHLGTHDALTGMPNRAILLDRAWRSLGRSELDTVCVVCVGLDGLKAVNESLGHLAGDAVLRETAARLAGHVRADDTVARIGGDQFAVLLDGVESDAEAFDLVAGLLGSVADPLSLTDPSAGSTDLVITASAGVAVGDTTSDPTELLRDAEAAMFRAKEKGRGLVELADERLSGAAAERFELEQDLRQAIELDQLSVVYQPIVHLATGTVTGVEALLRWHHPRRGEVSPAEFIPVAERTGLIIPIGEWVLARACCHASAWRARGIELDLAVNASVGQLADPRFLSVVERALAGAELPATELTLEVTETVMAEAPDVYAALHGLHELGVDVAIDDFGTGYSSLTLLRRLHVDELKVDLSFVRGLTTDQEDAAIVGAVVGLAHSLGERAVAEGVETAAQRQRLVEMGCDLGQGFLFSRPLPPDDLVTWLDGRPVGRLAH